MSESKKSGAAGIYYLVSPDVGDEEINDLFGVAWRDHSPREFAPVLCRSLAYVCAYRGGELVGFVNVTWDGGKHAFLLDTTVHPDQRRRGIGTELVRRTIVAIRDRESELLHVDFESRLTEFYRRCGFRHTEAGLLGIG